MDVYVWAIPACKRRAVPMSAALVTMCASDSLPEFPYVWVQLVGSARGRHRADCGALTPLRMFKNQQQLIDAFRALVAAFDARGAECAAFKQECARWHELVWSSEC